MKDFAGRAICINCVHATPDNKFENLDIDGDPTLVHCPYYPHSRVRTEVACPQFKIKDN